MQWRFLALKSNVIDNMPLDSRLTKLKIKKGIIDKKLVYQEAQSLSCIQANRSKPAENRVVDVTL